MRRGQLIQVVISLLVGVGTMAHAKPARAVAGWTQFTEGTPPKAWQPSNVPIGGTSIIYAVSDQNVTNTSGYDVTILTTSHSGSNYLEYYGSYLYNGETYTYSWADESLYYSGISASLNTSGSVVDFAWTANGALYESGSVLESGGWRNAVISSNSSHSPNDVFALNGNVTSCATSGYPAGTCLYNQTTDNHFGHDPGAAQIAQDSINVGANNIYLVDTSGRVWKYDFTTWTELTNAICASTGSITAAMVTEWDSLIYVLTSTSTGGGNVYVYSSVDACWAELNTAAPSGGFLSIGPSFGDNGGDVVPVVWATDTSGNIWYFHAL